MMTYQHDTVPARVGQRLAAMLASGRDTLHTWQQRRQARHALRGLLRLDDQHLADIGLHRSAVAWEAQQPFWKP